MIHKPKRKKTIAKKAVTKVIKSIASGNEDAIRGKRLVKPGPDESILRAKLRSFRTAKRK